MIPETNKPKIHIVDSIMGSGKTSAAITMIEHSSSDDHYIYITPFLKEVQRIIDNCPSKHFCQPVTRPNKIDGIKELLKKGRNIVTTHALFSNFDQEVIDLCFSQDYTLILDEVINVAEPYAIGKKDLQVLLKEFVNVDAKGVLSWKEEVSDYSDAKFMKEKILCNLQSLTLYADSVLMWLFPINIFKVFKETYILTYLFEGQIQKYYYDYYELDYDYIYVTNNIGNNYIFTKTESQYQTLYDYNQLINIIDHKKINKIGELDYSLTLAWYKKHGEDILIKQLKQNTINFFTNITKSKTKENLWTTFSDYKNKLKGKGYTKGFLSCNARATNDYKETINIAYLVNKYINPIIKQFFIQQGYVIDEDLYALSEMLQFIWRSGIREGKHITLYIPSRRMRNLLIDWIEEQSNEH